MYSSAAWYLIRTKSNREHSVRERLSRALGAVEIFVPMLKQPLARTSPALTPLFPQYVFARMDLGLHYFDVCYMPGVVGFVSAGREPLAVSDFVVESVRARCKNGIVEVNPRPFRAGERVRLIDGPFRDFDAIFDGYLSGARRVAILIETIQGSGLRMVTDASTVIRA
ncbi:MAG TPA: transcription termination/antitermination NusG family protein [Candidatus Binataceae bacterium]|nr:transcription termination/antitermination NusG family protein [Candidatus Binataceae bacterium]